MPERDPRDRVAKQKARAHGARPPYAGVLPGVFPYRKTMRKSEAAALVKLLASRMIQEELGIGSDDRTLSVGGGGVGPDMVGPWFALTSHPMRQDGGVRLWLSLAAVRYLHGEGYIDEVEET